MRIIVLSLQILLTIPLLTNVDLNLVIISKKSFNGSVSTTWKQIILNVNLYQPASVNVRGSMIKSSNCEKLLEIYIDSSFSFEFHINSICSKASQKLHALSRTAKYICEEKNCMLFVIQIFHNFAIAILQFWVCFEV